MKFSAQRQEVISQVLDGFLPPEMLTMEEAIELQSRIIDIIAERAPGGQAPTTTLQ